MKRFCLVASFCPGSETGIVLVATPARSLGYRTSSAVAAIASLVLVLPDID
jgi:hypothetical protein